MIIVIEGADGAGKTTLAAELSQRLGIGVYKFRGKGPLHGGSVVDNQYADEALMTLLEATRSDVIFDRSFPSEWAYGRVFKREFDVERIAALDERLAKLDHLCVFLRWYKDAELDDILERLDDEVSVGKVIEVNREYYSWMQGSRCQWLPLNALKPVGEMVEGVVHQLVKNRPQKDEVYMELARQVARRSTCLSRRNGAVMVSADGHVVATGYNGPPPGSPHPTECPRLRNGVASGTGLELCEDVHSEENCVAQAAKKGTSVAGGTMYTLFSPCHRCWRMLRNAGVAEVVYEMEYGDTRALTLPGIEIRKLERRRG